MWEQFSVGAWRYGSVVVVVVVEVWLLVGGKTCVTTHRGTLQPHQQVGDASDGVWFSTV